MKKKVVPAMFAALLIVLVFVLTGCNSGKAEGDQVFDYGGTTLRILSGSENKELADIMDVYAKKNHITIVMDYKGSLDIMRALQAKTIDYDAVWPASSLWLNAGDAAHRVKHAKSISVTPLVFGIRQSIADQLGFVDKEVSVGDLLTAIKGGKLKFCMTSATQSNSGCSAYIGLLYAMLGSPDEITSAVLQSSGLVTDMRSFFSGVDRSSGSSDWLKDMYLAGDFDAMVNYECLVISANRQLESEGRETMYTIYPYDGLSLADSPLGYVDNGDATQEDSFLKLQAYLLSDEVQAQIQRTGRRTGYEGVSAENSDVFRTDWGIQPERVLSPIKMPTADVLTDCLNLYQTELRKPSLTVYCLDFSDSMAGNGHDQMVDAMREIMVQQNAERSFLQASAEDISIVIPFDGSPRDVQTGIGNGVELENLYDEILRNQVGGSTNIYLAALAGMDALKDYDLSKYTVAVILLTDGQSIGEYDDFSEKYKGYAGNVPVFSIMFGDADGKQLEQLANLTNARVFDGRKDLVGAFRSAKGYN